jgi:transcriptional regulator with XRE-family HTH domain
LRLPCEYRPRHIRLAITLKVMEIRRDAGQGGCMDLQNPQTFGDLLRLWRGRRRLSQLALALGAEVSQRHLSFVESGRSRPSREMILRLAETLHLPLRDRNAMLLAAGFAPAYGDRPLTSPDMARTRAMIDRLLAAHAPHPALALDGGWTVLAMNAGVGRLIQGVDPSLLEGEINALRLTLHPQGLAPRIVNFHIWRDHILGRLAHDIERSADPRLVTLLAELRAYPAPYRSRPASAAPAEIAVPLILETEEGRLSFLSTTTVFGTAVDVTLADLVIETFLPADDQTAEILSRGERPFVG